MMFFPHTSRCVRAGLALVALAAGALIGGPASAQICSTPPIPGELLVVDKASDPTRVIAVDTVTGDQCEVPSGDTVVPFPRGIAVADDGRLYVTADGGTILRIDPANPTTAAIIAGDPVIPIPRGVAIEPILDADGQYVAADRLYFASAFIFEPARVFARIWRTDAVSGSTTVRVAEGGNLYLPSGLVRESDGNLIVTDEFDGGCLTPCGLGIFRIFPNAYIEGVVGDFNQEVITRAGILQRPRRSALLTDDLGATAAIFVTDSGIPGVVCVPLVDSAGDPLPFDLDDPAANQVLVTSDGEFSRPLGIVVEEKGDATTPASLLVTDGTTDRVVRVSFDAGDPCPAEDSGVQSVVSQDGLFVVPWEAKVAKPVTRFLGLPYYVSDADGVYRVDPRDDPAAQPPLTPSRVQLAAVGDMAGGVELERPAGVALDRQGNVLVTDPEAKAVFRIPLVDGEADPPVFGPLELVVAGQDLVSQVALERPTGIVADSAGKDSDTGDYLVVDAGDRDVVPPILPKIVRVRFDRSPPATANGLPQQILVAEADELFLLNPIAGSFDEQGQLVVADAGDATVEPHLVVVDPISSPIDPDTSEPLAGRAVIPTPPPPALPPLGDVVLDSDDTLLIAPGEAPADEKLVRVLTPNAGGAGGFVYRPESGSTLLGEPREIDLDLDRSVLMVDADPTQGAAVLRIDTVEAPDFDPAVVYSGPTSDPDGRFALNDPWGIAIEILPAPATLDADPEGSLVVGDGVDDTRDNCPNVRNPKRCNLDRRIECTSDADCIPKGPCVQFDLDGDGRGNACDNCLEVANIDPRNPAFPQPDEDGDGLGDACDADLQCDVDRDGTVDVEDQAAIEAAFGDGATCGLNASCTDNTDCAPGNVCINAGCREKNATPPSCVVSGDCLSGDLCFDDPGSDPTTRSCYTLQTRACTLDGTECGSSDTCLAAPEDCDLSGTVDQSDVDLAATEFGLTEGPGLDFDDDGVTDTLDNCPDSFNPRVCCPDGAPCSAEGLLCDDSTDCGTGETCEQPDINGDGFGDACQPDDFDGDGLIDLEDNCPEFANPDQADEDRDNQGDICDACPSSPPRGCSGDESVACLNDDECQGLGSCLALELACSNDPNLACSDDGDCQGGGSCSIPLRLACSDDDSRCNTDADCTSPALCLQIDGDNDFFPDLCDNCVDDANRATCAVDSAIECSADAQCPPFPCIDEICSGGTGGSCDTDADCEPQTCAQSDVNQDTIGDVCQPDDADGDGVPSDGDGSGIVGDNFCSDGNPLNCDDNCLDAKNADQTDSDGDGRGNACDSCDFDPNPALACNVTGDACLVNADCTPEVCDKPMDQQTGTCSVSGATCRDNFDCGEQCDIPQGESTGTCANNPLVACSDDFACQLCIQTDSDGDGQGDVCDNCPDDPMPLQPDADGDGRGTACDNCPTVPNPPRCAMDRATTCTVDEQCAPGDVCIQLDTDEDTVGDACDNCSEVFNLNQTDSNGDGFGNVCDADYSNDGLVGGPDFLLLIRAFGAMPGDNRYDPDLDRSDDPAGDGIGGPEYIGLASEFGSAPGPSCDLPPGQSCTAP